MENTEISQEKVATIRFPFSPLFLFSLTLNSFLVVLLAWLNGQKQEICNKILGNALICVTGYSFACISVWL